MFIRVRYADPTFPVVEFDAPVKAVERFEGRYVVIDDTPVSRPRPKVRPESPGEDFEDDAPEGAGSPEEEASNE